MTTNLSPLHRRLIVAITLSAAFLSVLTQFLLITAFPEIMNGFTINSTQVQWLTTSFMLTAAIFIPITAFFIDRFKTRTLMMGAMCLFFVGTFIGLMAPNFPVLITGRVVQGIGSGVMIPLMQTILFLLYPREKRGFAMGLAGMVINVAPAVGPPISGLLINYLEWRALFYLILPIAAVILIMVFFFMQNVTKQRETKIDIASILLSSIGFGGMLYGFNQIQEVGLTDTVTLVTLIAGAVSLCLFVLRQLKIEKPILEVRVLAVPIFSLVAIISILGFSLLISTETILPLYIQNAQGYSAYYSGLIVMPGALTLAIMSMLAGNLFDKYGGRLIAIIGFLMITASTLSFHFLLELDTPFILPMVLFMVAMGGVALINMPIMTTGINALPDELIPHGTSVINTARQFGGSLGLTFIISFITKAQTTTADIQPSDYLDGIKTSFFISFLFAIIGLALSYFVGKKKRVREHE